MFTVYAVRNRKIENYKALGQFVSLWRLPPTGNKELSSYTFSFFANQTILMDHPLRKRAKDVRRELSYETPP